MLNIYLSPRLCQTIKFWRAPPPPMFSTRVGNPAEVMLILILIDVQYLQKVDYSFQKGLNGQTHSSSGSHHQVKKTGKISDSPSHWGRNSPSLTLFGKPWSSWGSNCTLVFLSQIFRYFPAFLSSFFQQMHH